MTIFQLFLYSCVTASSLSGDLMSKTCRWDARDFYAAQSTCLRIGADEIGKPIFSDIYERRLIEKHRCDPRSVIE